MSTSSNLLRTLLVIFLLAAPATALKIASFFSDNPYLQPLALTREGLAAFGEGGFDGATTHVEIRVNWGRGWPGPLTRAQLRTTLTDAIAPWTDRYRFDFHNGKGTDVTVTFIVGPNRYGPYPPGQLANGLNTALIALRMSPAPDG